MKGKHLLGVAAELDVGLEEGQAKANGCGIRSANYTPALSGASHTAVGDKLDGEELPLGVEGQVAAGSLRVVEGRTLHVGGRLEASPGGHDAGAGNLSSGPGEHLRLRVSGCDWRFFGIVGLTLNLRGLAIASDRCRGVTLTKVVATEWRCKGPMFEYEGRLPIWRQ